MSPLFGYLGFYGEHFPNGNHQYDQTCEDRQAINHLLPQKWSVGPTKICEAFFAIAIKKTLITDLSFTA
jgi:hypothetical protein